MDSDSSFQIIYFAANEPRKKREPKIENRQFRFAARMQFRLGVCFLF